MKKLINAPDQVVSDALRGIEAAHGERLRVSFDPAMIVLVEKIAGGAAEAGLPLAQLAEIGRRVNAQGRSMGMALTPCITPASGEPSFELGEDEVEIGIGIHGEPGHHREKLGTASQVAERLLTPIREDLPFTSGDRVLAFVNGMGGTPLALLGERSARHQDPGATSTYHLFESAARALAG